MSFRVKLVLVLISLGNFIFSAMYDTAYQATFLLSLIWVSGPAALGIAVFSWFCMHSEVRTMSWPARIGWLSVGSMTIVLLMMGYVLFLNTVIGKQEPVVLSGEIIDKFRSPGRHKGYYVVVDFAAEGDTLRWPVSYQEFDSVRIGDSFERHVRRGGLGLLYRKREWSEFYIQ